MSGIKCPWRDAAEQEPARQVEIQSAAARYLEVIVETIALILFHFLFVLVALTVWTRAIIWLIQGARRQARPDPPRRRPAAKTQLAPEDSAPEAVAVEFKGWLRFGTCEWISVEFCHDREQGEVWRQLSNVWPGDEDAERCVLPENEVPIPEES